MKLILSLLLLFCANLSFAQLPSTTTEDDDLDPENEIQTLEVNDEDFELSISDGNTINLPSLWTKNGSNIYYLNGNGKVSIGTPLTNNIGILNIMGNATNCDIGGTIKTQQGISSNDTGYFGVKQNDTSPFLAYMGTNLEETAGFFSVRDLDDNPLVNISMRENDVTGYTAGYLVNYFSNGSIASSVTTTLQNASGAIATRDINNTSNCILSSLLDNPSHGYISIYGEDGYPNVRAGMYVNEFGQGIVFGDTKNFVQDHPHDEDKEIWYASIEGPEAAAYVRGTATLKNGSADIEFPEHFEIVANPETMTILLTPLSANSKGMSVTKKGEKGFVVKELMNGDGSYEFDWEAKAVRKGYEDYRVIRDKKESMPADIYAPASK